MRKLMMIGCAVAVAASAILPVSGDIICSGESAAVYVNTTLPTTVDKRLTLCASAWGDVGESVTVAIDGAVAFSTTNQTETAWRWQPLTTGNHTLTCTFGTNVLTKTLNVTALDFFVQPSPNPPMAKDDNLSITPTTRNFSVGGGGNAIITSGSGTWTAAVSDPWITLSATSGEVGYPVAYTVSANTNVEQRTGYVYVSGWVHTVTQDGVGGTIAPENATFEHQGGSNTIAVTAANKMVWQARPNVDWLSVSPTSGAGEGSVTYQVAPYDEVATRQGTLTVAGNTFTVLQYGRRMKLDTYLETRNYEAHVIPIMVNALAATTWNVWPNNSWISIVDAGNGRGGDLVTIAIAENPSYKARTGTVTIGTETFTVTQQGRPTEALSFNVSPVNSTASVNGANGMVAVTATPDLPWTATSGANWITVYAATANGAGNGNVVYNASPNPTLSQRTGKVTVTPEAASGMSAKTHTVTQPAAESSLSLGGYEFEASGESCSVEVSVADIVQWTIENTNSWITVNGSTSRVGPGPVTLQAAANNTVYPRSGTVTIAGKTFSVSQKARGVELEYDTKLFETDGGYESISIHPDGNSAWTAVASDATWITIFQGASGTGDGEILYIVAPYNGDGSARTGWIEVGDKKVYITQRPYELSIEPNGSVVKGNNGAGEFGVAADSGAVWNAIVTEPWITLVSGYDAGTGSGTVRFICADNNTGKARTGKIVVAGEVYTVTQSERILVRVQAEAGHGGSLTGSGTYDKGIKITLTAIPDEGYRFVRWTGPVSSTANPLTMDADEITDIRAEFEPLSPTLASARARSGETGVALSWNSFAWATTYAIYRGASSVRSEATLVAEIQNDGKGTYLDDTATSGARYWYWVEADGPEDHTVSAPLLSVIESRIDYLGLRGASHSNPASYDEGTSVVFSPPGAVTGYSFAGWTPTQITADMTGNQTVRASWIANTYTITYDPDGGNVTPASKAVDYDEVYGELPAPTRGGFTFNGWWTAKTGGAQVTEDTKCTGDATIYARWTAKQYKITFNANGGGVTPEYRMVDYCATYGDLPTPVRGGYVFDGWWTATEGGTLVTASTKCTGNATVYARWTVVQYVVTFNANGGSGGWSRSMEYGAALAAPTVTRAGYTFAGWSPAVPSAVPAGNVTYTAQWQANQYTVTFNANGGSGGWSRSMACGSALAAPTVTRTGYTFAGWSPAVPSTVPAGNVTYTAQWQIIQYVVTFDANGGIGGTTRTLTGGPSSVGTLPVPEWSDGIFDGWFTAADGGAQVTADTWVTGDVTYYAHWTLWTYDVDGNSATVTGIMPQQKESLEIPTALGGKPVTSIGSYAFYSYSCLTNVTISDSVTSIGGGAFWDCSGLRSVTIPASVMDIGYWAFDGCSKLTTVYVDIDDAARVRGMLENSGFDTQGVTFKERFAVVRFDANGGVASFPDMTVDVGAELGDLPTPTWGGHTFNGWFTARTGGERVTEETVCFGSATIYAQWKVNQYKIAFSGNGGTVSPTYRMVDYCKTYGDLPTPKWAGHTFNGWFTARTGGTQVTAATKCTGNATIYAHWTVNQYKVAFSGNGGTVSPTYRMVDYCATYGDLPTPTWGGHTFNGWFTARTGGSPVTAATKCVGNATIYAQWTVKQYKLTYDANGGTVSPASRMVDYCATYGDLPTPTWGGHTFVGWFTARSGGTQVTSATKCVGNASIYAQWKVNQYKIAFSGNGGTVSPTYRMVDYCKTYGDLPTPTWAGHTFNGWFTARTGGSPVTAATKCIGNATIYAQWTTKQYKLTFNANGGTVSQASRMVDCCATYGDLPVPFWDGRTFVGWFTAASGGTLITPATKCVGNATVYAQWSW